MPAFEYKAGGSLQKDFPGYVTRAADEELFLHARAGDFCFVLTARQMGKSSLRVRTSERLQAAGIACASIDITAIGSTELAPGQWYYSFLMPLMRSLKLDRDFRAWWPEQQVLTPVNRLIEALRWMLARYDGRIVVCIDEIDSLLSIDRRVLNPDDFFAALRVCYNLRADEAAWERLSFVLLGVAAPGDLMSDDTRTPFNIGIPIVLSNFTADEARPLAAGLDHLRVAGQTGQGEALLREVLRWTGGQPYLTQKLCADLAGVSHDLGDAAAAVDAQVQQSFLAPGLSAADANLANTQARVAGDTGYALPMLGLHRRLLAGEPVPANPRDPAQLYYRLAGMGLDRGGYLTLNNDIYRQVFGPDWLEQAIARLDRPLSRALERWLGNQRLPAYLLAGVDLEEAEAWAAGRSDLSPEERSYLEASRQARDQARVAEAERKAAAEARRSRITRRWALLAAALACLALAGAGVAAWQWWNADGARKQEQALRMQADSLRTVAVYEKNQADSLRNTERLAKEDAVRRQQEADSLRDAAEAAYRDARQRRMEAEAAARRLEISERATAAARDCAREEAARARDAEAQAKAAYTQADEAARALRERNTRYVRELLVQVPEKISRLQMAEACRLVSDALEVGADSIRARTEAIRLIFFYTEAGIFDSAAALLAAARLPLPPGPDSLTRLRTALTGRIDAGVRDAFYPPMVEVRGGTFMMGLEQAEWRKLKKEYSFFSASLPLHQVTVSDFGIGRYEVTVQQWHLYARSTRQEMPPAPSWGWTGDHPVVNVSWEDATAYCAWLSRQTGQAYRLPTEAEWEYAAGGGSRGRTSYAGTSELDSLSRYANFCDEECEYDYESKPNQNDGYRYTAPAGSYAPNRLGLYDLSGNVWEWCGDWYGEYPSGAQTNPEGPSQGVDRVLRGGGWLNDAEGCRVASRYDSNPGNRDDNRGFRLARQ